MKKIILVLLIVLSIAEIKAQEFNGGLYGSVNMMQLDGDNYGGYNKAGFAGGVYINRFIKKDAMAFQLGLRYIQKGSRARNNSYKCKLNYIEMPVTVLIRLNDKTKIRINDNAVKLNRFFFEAGLTVGYLMKSTEFINGVEELDPPPFHKMELGAIGGINYEITERVNMGFHFLYSILFVRPYSQDYNTMNKGQHNNLLTLSLALKLSNWK